MLASHSSSHPLLPSLPLSRPHLHHPPSFPLSLFPFQLQAHIFFITVLYVHQSFSCIPAKFNSYIPSTDPCATRLAADNRWQTPPAPGMPPRNSFPSSFSTSDVNNEVVCPLRNHDGTNCRKRCLGVSATCKPLDLIPPGLETC